MSARPVVGEPWRRHGRGRRREGGGVVHPPLRPLGRDRRVAAVVDQARRGALGVGLAEVHQVLLRNDLRDRVVLRSDGGLQTGCALACSPEPSSAAPISGGVEDCEVEFQHTMRVVRIWEAPRVTKPYTEAQWREIEALGRHIDGDLLEHDVRLTQGGEPTFVSVDDRDGAEWNTEAMGPDKARTGGAAAGAAEGTITRRTASCITARASGIRASSCRAGR